jgi:hypothetical protein
MSGRRDICLNNGKTSELLFEELLTKKNVTFKKSDSIDDMVNKIDYYMGKTNVSIQIKSEPKTGDDTRCVEFIDVRGNNGWMISKAEIIAFETSYGFLLVKISDIWDLLKDKLVFYKSDVIDFEYDNEKPLSENIQNHYKLMKKSNSLYKSYYKSVEKYNLYTRADWDGQKRWDFCTKVPLSDLESISVAKLKKK